MNNGIKGLVLVCLTSLILLSKTDAQELNLDVRINTPALKLADPEVFKTMETAIKEFMNNTVWTDDNFDKLERIEGSIQINIKDDVSSNSFVADFLISAARPIYGSNYYSPLMNHIDKDIQFKYEQFQPLYNNNNAWSDNLSAVLSFYAYIIIGMDYDSFAPAGGERSFNIAQGIVNSAPNTASSREWKAVGATRNKYWLSENLLNPRIRPFRMAFYDYHRTSLDKMHQDPIRARAEMLSALQAISLVNAASPNSMLLKLFSDSKRNEIKEIYKAGSRGEKSKVYDIMAALDPAQQNDFKEFRGFK